MNSDVSPFLSLFAVIRGLRGGVAAWGGIGWLEGGLVLLVYRRLGEMLRRLEGLVTRFQAGAVRRRAGRAVGTPEDGEAVRPARGGAVRVWPLRFGWLVRAAGWQAAGFGCQLRAVLETPEMMALLADCPQAVRVLTPLCRMLAIETSVLRVGRAAAVGAGPDEPVRVARVRAVRVKPDLGRVPIPRGIVSAVRRGRALLG